MELLQDHYSAVVLFTTAGFLMVGFVAEMWLAVAAVRAGIVSQVSGFPLFVTFLAVLAGVWLW